ncbi:D-alanyl-D-alanine carboxypeptidase/D-alanyl-D-alanine endopeptidase [Aromatoleum petrolei]|uniref:D-alanyl-D-alanine carboxypeptidase/D-alanyl-D-alanine-endopeptidase n=1 Tax=Aromatoleum petrolei TaxID=76116 RepID=A0ABX1MQ24_9RHOO|nr:D-alanyl-D-alanine carboxypeptidase/D-alanyl-D-alanine-endopeptidase [Aromatoleum petrolei]NMF90020.1 D-alanyl-D-alanine carboxypeptidase/D-alanyl-D-alanine-endopeptidase [Aromatoleum petrolei]
MTTQHVIRFLAALYFCGMLAAAQAAAMPPGVRQALDAARIPASNVAVWVQAVDASAPQLEFGGEQPMNPASVMKVVTAFAALDRLGPAFTWTTRVATGGPVAAGVLDGSLYLAGGADPMLNYERLGRLLRQVRALGITAVRGDIVLDGSALALPPHDPAAFDGRALRPYNSGAYGLLMHFNTLQLRLVPPAEPGRAVGVAPYPSLTGVDIDNRIMTGPGPCGVWYGNLEATLEAGPQGPRLVLSGSMPASCGQRDWATAPLSPEAFGRALVAALWNELGGKVEGSVRSGVTPADAATLLTETSPPLAEVVREMNKWSSNVIARQLLATLGREGGASLDMVAGGAEAVKAQLVADGIATAGLVIENGSGLSRIERVSARTLAEVLLAAWRRPFMPEFIAALPIAGEDGTARGRLHDSPARGYAHIKTGSINGVKSLAGYVLDRHGRRHAVVMMVNHAEAGASQAAQDALLEWVWATGGEAEPSR